MSRRPSNNAAKLLMLGALNNVTVGCKDDPQPELVDFHDIKESASSCRAEDAVSRLEDRDAHFTPQEARVEDGMLIVDAVLHVNNDLKKSVTEQLEDFAVLVVEPEGDSRGTDDVYGDMYFTGFEVGEDASNRRGEVDVSFEIPLDEAPFTIEDGKASLNLWVGMGETTNQNSAFDDGECNTYVPVGRSQRFTVTGPADGLYDDGGSVWTVD